MFLLRTIEAVKNCKILSPTEDRKKHISGLEQQIKKLTAEEEANWVKLQLTPSESAIRTHLSGRSVAGQATICPEDASDGQVLRELWAAKVKGSRIPLNRAAHFYPTVIYSRLTCYFRDVKEKSSPARLRMAMELGKKLGEWNRQRAAKGLPPAPQTSSNGC